MARSHLSSSQAQAPAQHPPSSAGLSNIQLLEMAAKKAMETIRSIAMVLTGTTKLEKVGGGKPGALNQGQTLQVKQLEAGARQPSLGL